MSTARVAAVFDAVIVGAGIAGLSVAAELASDRSVVVLEQDALPAMQTTGRSAAQFIADYGGPRVAPFTRASRAWFDDGGGHAHHALMTRRGMLVVATEHEQLDALARRGRALIAAADAAELFPALRADRVCGAMYDPDVADIDVAESVAAFRRSLSAAGATVRCDERFVSASRTSGTWRIETTERVIHSELVVNSAGAWADQVAGSCGLPSLGLRPLRRTACTFRATSPEQGRWPLLNDAGGRWYLKPEPGQFMASPCDETPSPPCDAQPEQLDVALALDHVRENTTLPSRSITSAWAGLRTFAPDRGLVLGPDPLEPSFVWCAGQGGVGIQTSPAAAATVASLVRSGGVTDLLAAAGIDPSAVSPARFR